MNNNSIKDLPSLYNSQQILIKLLQVVKKITSKMSKKSEHQLIVKNLIRTRFLESLKLPKDLRDSINPRIDILEDERIRMEGESDDAKTKPFLELYHLCKKSLIALDLINKEDLTLTEKGEEALEIKNITNLSSKQIKSIKDFYLELFWSGYKLKSKVISLLTGRGDRNELKGEATDLIVDYILKNKHIKVLDNSQSKEFLIYENGLYINEGKLRIQEISSDILGKFYTDTLSKNIVDKITVSGITQNPNDFYKEHNLDYVCLENGLFNLKTKKLSDFTPEIILFQKLPITYNPKAKCPNIQKHLKTVLKTEEDIKAFYELAGYTLLRSYPIQKFALFLGKGQNGKGICLQILSNFLGLENTSALSLQDLTSLSFMIENLHNSLANLGAELPNTRMPETDMLKRLVEDLLEVNRKFRGSLKFKNYAKLIFSANELPSTPDTTDGFFRRWLYFEFPYQFLHKEDIKEKEARGEDISKLKIAVPKNKLLENLLTREEMSGLFNEALKGLDRLLKNNKFSNHNITENTRLMWQRAENSLGAFLNEFIEEADSIDIYISKEEFRTEYEAYCDAHNLSVKTNKQIKEILKDKFKYVGEGRPTHPLTKKRITAWTSITFKDDIVKPTQKQNKRVTPHPKPASPDKGEAHTPSELISESINKKLQNKKNKNEAVNLDYDVTIIKKENKGIILNKRLQDILDYLKTDKKFNVNDIYLRIHGNIHEEKKLKELEDDLKFLQSKGFITNPETSFWVKV